MNKQTTHYDSPHCEYAKWQEEHMLCSSDIVESEDFNDLTNYEW